MHDKRLFHLYIIELTMKNLLKYFFLKNPYNASYSHSRLDLE